MEILRVIKCGKYRCSTGWQFYVYMVAILHVTKCGTFTCNTVWHFYLKHSLAVFLITQGGNFT